jgi:hypothetical protein
MELNIQKNKLIYLTRKTNSIHFNYHVSDVSVLCTDSIKDLMLGSKLHFQCHADYVHSKAVVVVVYLTTLFQHLRLYSVDF